MTRFYFAITGLLLSGLQVASAQQPFTGNIPLPTLGQGTYQGFEGGLYPGGLNTPPEAHAEAARLQREAFEPLDVHGKPDPQSGLIGVIAVGMSNTTQEFKVFERYADLKVDRSPHVVLVNGAHGGQAADVIADPDADYWALLDGKLQAAGVAAPQVQGCWIKQAQTDPLSEFPAHAQDLQADLKQIVQILRDRYPNLRACFLSSRIYGGYSARPDRGEPLSYETGFAVKWLIEDQINGAPELNFDPDQGPVEAPLLLWGPYLWADGINQSETGLRWLRFDMEDDGVHPSLRGELKVGRLLRDFFYREEWTRPWWRRHTQGAVFQRFVRDDAHVDAAAPDGNFGGLPVLQVAANEKTAYLRVDASRIDRDRLIHAKLSLRGLSAVRVSLESAADSDWDEHTITFNNAPLTIGPVISAGAAWSRDSSPSFDVTSVLREDDDGILTLVLERAVEDLDPTQELASHESWVGRPVLIVSHRGWRPPDQVFLGGFEIAY